MFAGIKVSRWLIMLQLVKKQQQQQQNKKLKIRIWLSCYVQTTSTRGLVFPMLAACLVKRQKQV